MARRQQQKEEEGLHGCDLGLHSKSFKYDDDLLKIPFVIKTEFPGSVCDGIRENQIRINDPEDMLKGDIEVDIMVVKGDTLTR